MDIDPTTEAMIAVMCAMSEQLDIERLLVGLHRQHDVFAAADKPQAQEVARLLRVVGSALSQVQDLRSLKKTPSN